MSQYVLINRIQVQDANAIAGFTWGFPAITHFLGFTHNLSRKLKNHDVFSDIQLSGCAVIVHQHHVQTYGYNQFTQTRKPAFQYKEQSKYKVGTLPIIEEGKMNLTVSLLIGCEGNIHKDEDRLLEWFNQSCQLQRLAGGTILDIANIQFFTLDDEQHKNNLRILTRKLLPGFVLQDRSHYLEQHIQTIQKQDENAELFDAWLDFIALKQKARPLYHLINQHLTKQAESDSGSSDLQSLLESWLTHLEQPYEQKNILEALKGYFASLPESKNNKKLQEQWQNYCEPTSKTQAIWEYVKKPKPGFLVPLMVGYKAISGVYESHEIANTRDHETDVCFVEAVHSIGEWQGIHQIRDATALSQCLWHYHHEPHWYLCRQNPTEIPTNTTEIIQPDDDDY